MVRWIAAVTLIIVAALTWIEPLAHRIPGWGRLLLMLVGLCIALYYSFGARSGEQKDQSNAGSRGSGDGQKGTRDE